MKFENGWGRKVAYAVTFKASAFKQTEKLPKSLSDKILAKAALLADDPRPSGCIKLTGSNNLWRYVIDDERKTVDIRIVAHRREVGDCEQGSRN